MIHFRRYFGESDKTFLTIYGTILNRGTYKDFVTMKDIVLAEESLNTTNQNRRPNTVVIVPGSTVQLHFQPLSHI